MDQPPGEEVRRASTAGDAPGGGVGPRDEALRVQVGWVIYSRDGHELGSVAGFDAGKLVVQAHGMAAHRKVNPVHYIAREMETEMRARLAVDDREAQAFVERGRHGPSLHGEHGRRSDDPGAPA